MRTSRRLVEFVDSVLGDCAAGRVSVSGEDWGGRTAGGAAKLTPANCLPLVDRCLLELLWRQNLADLGAGRAAGTGPLAPWLAGKYRYREKIAAGLRPGRAGGGRFRYWLLDGARADRLVLLLTHACQLRCSYCIIGKYPAQAGRRAVKGACDLLLSSERKAVWLQFFGGEPLLQFDLLRYASDYLLRRAAAAGRTAGLGLTTNGLALDAAKLAFIKSRGIFVEVSCDGAEADCAAARALRCGAYAPAYRRLVANLDSLRKSGIPYRVIMVVTPGNVGRMEANYGVLAGLGHRAIQVNYALGMTWSGKDAGRFAAGLAACGRLSRSAGAEFVNYSEPRREPVALNSELYCDCDGTLYRETGLCVESDFEAVKERFRAGSVLGGADMNTLGNTQFDNLYMITSAYGSSRKRMELVMNNAALGMRLAARRASAGKVL